MAGGVVALSIVAIAVGLGPWRSRAADPASEIAREPLSPSHPLGIPSAHPAEPLPAEEVRPATDSIASDAHDTPRDPGRVEPPTPRDRDREKPSDATPDADELLERALTARREGKLDAANGLLQTIRNKHPGSSQAAIAAAYLGRDAARRDERDAARRWFEIYLQEQPNGPLAREASGQLIELTTGPEQKERAREYLAQHPNGPHAPLARRVLAAAP
ncbi:MAG: hypothetical protein U0270_20130 [Labilithrix sp.]